MDSLLNKLTDTIEKFNMINPGDRILVGLSGGADSCVLLYALNALSEKLSFTVAAAHLNHGIRGKEAKRDEEHAEKFAKSLNVEFFHKEVSVPLHSKEHKISEEMSGRQLRYEFFDDLCKEYSFNKIAVAHNKNDRAETILLNLLRGTGVNGISGIKPVNKNIIRPLIDVTREEIEKFAYDNSISYVNDSTNNEDVYARNIIRNHILTKMAQINAAAIDNIVRSSDIISKECALTNEYLGKICPLKYEDGEVYIDRKIFTSLDTSQKTSIIFKSAEKLLGSSQNISSAEIENAVKINSTGKKYTFSNSLVFYSTSDAFILTESDIDIPPYKYNIFFDNPCYVKETGITYLFEAASEYIKQKNSIYVSIDNIDISKLQLRTKQDGDVFTPYGFKGTKKLKKYYIDEKIPKNKRNLYPVLTLDDEILALIPLRVSENYKVTQNTKKLLKITILGGTYEKL